MAGQAVDRIAKLQEEIAELSAQMEVLKDQLKQRGVGEYLGSEFVATVSEFERRTIDADKVKRILTPAQLRRVTVKTECTMLRLKPIES